MILAQVQRCQLIIIACQRCQAAILFHVQFCQFIIATIQLFQLRLVPDIQLHQLISRAIQFFQLEALADIQRHQVVVGTIKFDQFPHAIHYDIRYIVIGAIHLLKIQPIENAQIHVGQFIIGAIQFFQSARKNINRLFQLILGTIQLLQFEIFANIKCCQADTVAIQLFEIFKETDSFKTFDCITGWNRHILDIHIKLAIAICVTTILEKAPKFRIREIKLKIRRIKINFCVRRKGAEGQKGEYHCQRQEHTDKARSF